MLLKIVTNCSGILRFRPAGRNRGAVLALPYNTDYATKYHTAKEYTPHSGAPRHRLRHTGQGHHGATRCCSFHNPLGHCHQIPILAGLAGKVVKAMDAFNPHERIGQMRVPCSLAVGVKHFPLLAVEGMEGQRAKVVARAGFECSEVFHIP